MERKSLITSKSLTTLKRFSTSKWIYSIVFCFITFCLISIPLSSGSKRYTFPTVPRLDDEIRDLWYAITQRVIQVKVGYFACPGTTGDYSVTGIGFQPRYVEFTAQRTHAVVSEFMNGVMDYNGNQWAMAATGSDNEQRSKSTNSYCIQLHYWNDGVIQVRAVFVSMDADGFTINFNLVNTNRNIKWKAVR